MTKKYDWHRYNPGNRVASYDSETDVPDRFVAEALISQVWEKYLKIFRYRWKESTFFYLLTTIKKWVKSAPFTIREADLYRNWLLDQTTISMAKRILTWVGSAVRWWCDKNYLPNYFKNVAQGLKHKWEISTNPRPFSHVEVNYIESKFEGSKYYSIYLPLVRFLLSTGCRPSEAVGLKWSRVEEKHIIFSGGITISGGRTFRSNTSKNNKIRSFPINDKIQEILSIQKGKNPLWVFPAPLSNKPINYNNFRGRAWKQCAGKIVPESTPYNCRDTFISNQLKAGIPPAYIAKWCDTSIQLIERFYFAISDDYLPI